MAWFEYHVVLREQLGRWDKDGHQLRIKLQWPGRKGRVSVERTVDVYVCRSQVVRHKTRGQIVCGKTPGSVL